MVVKDDVDEHKKKAHSTKMAKVNELAKLGKNPSEIAKEEVEGSWSLMKSNLSVNSRS